MDADVIVVGAGLVFDQLTTTHQSAQSARRDPLAADFAAPVAAGRRAGGRQARRHAATGVVRARAASRAVVVARLREKRDSGKSITADVRRAATGLLVAESTVWRWLVTSDNASGDDPVERRSNDSDPAPPE